MKTVLIEIEVPDEFDAFEDSDALDITRWIDKDLQEVCKYRFIESEVLATPSAGAVPDANARTFITHEGWINELGLLGEKDDLGSGWVRNAIRTIYRGLSANPATSPIDGRGGEEVTDEMALAFHRAITDGAIGQSELDEIKVGLRAALVNSR